MISEYSPKIRVHPVGQIGWSVISYDGDMLVRVCAFRKSREAANNWAVGLLAHFNDLYLKLHGISTEIELAEAPDEDA